MYQPIRIFRNIKVIKKKVLPQKMGKADKTCYPPPPPTHTHVKNPLEGYIDFHRSWGIATFFHREQTFTGVHKNSV